MTQNFITTLRLTPMLRAEMAEEIYLKEFQINAAQHFQGPGLYFLDIYPPTGNFLDIKEIPLGECNSVQDLHDSLQNYVLYTNGIVCNCSSVEVTFVSTKHVEDSRYRLFFKITQQPFTPDKSIYRYKKFEINVAEIFEGEGEYELLVYSEWEVHPIKLGYIKSMCVLHAILCSLVTGCLKCIYSCHYLSVLKKS
jgi:hypothetical protein